VEALSTMIANVYDDAISWAFASKDKLHTLAQLDDGDSIVNHGGSIVSSSLGDKSSASSDMSRISSACFGIQII
jgi:hypothetical protein